MNDYTFIVTVTTDNFDHAEQVMAERLGYDEQYEDEDGTEFDYTVDFEVFDTEDKS